MSQTIREIKLGFGTGAHKDKLRKKAVEVVLELQQSLETADPSETRAISKFLLEESWGNIGFRSSDWRSDQGGTDTLFEGSSKSVALEALWQRVSEWRENGYKVQAAHSSDGIETLVRLKNPDEVHKSMPIGRPVGLKTQRYAFGCSHPKHGGNWAKLWKNSLSFDYRRLQRQAQWHIEGSLFDVMAVHPQGNHVALGTRSGEVIIINSADGTICGRSSVGSNPGTRDQITELTYNRDGRYLAGLSDGLYVWDSRDLGLISKQPGDSFDSIWSKIAFIQENHTELLYLLQWDGIKVLDPSIGRLVKVLKPLPGESYLSSLSPDGKKSLILSDDEQVATVWNLENASVEWELFSDSFNGYRGRNACFHPSGNLCALGEPGRVTVWSVPEGELVSDLRFDRDASVESVEFSPGGRHLAVVLSTVDIVADPEYAEPESEYTCVICDWEWGAQLSRFPRSGNMLGFSANGSHLVIASSDGDVHIWTVEDGKPPHQTTRHDWAEPPDFDNQGRPYGHPNYGDDW